MQENKSNVTQDVKEGGIGRTHAATEGGEHQQEQENNKRDISEIDQQEGTMNNGTLGGNFDTSGSSANADRNSS